MDLKTALAGIALTTLLAMPVGVNAFGAPSAGPAQATRPAGHREAAAVKPKTKAIDDNCTKRHARGSKGWVNCVVIMNG